MNTSYVYQSAQVGEFRPAMLFANGPASYLTAGDPVYNAASNEYINFPMDCTSQSGNYKVRFIPTNTGAFSQAIRAGAPSPGQSGWTAIWEYAGTNNAPQVGVPLTLGPLSGAATASAMTANGVVTVTTATPPPLNSFVLITNGASGKGIFMNGAIVQVTSVVPGVSFGFNFAAAKSLNYASGADTIKWQQLLGGAAGNPVALGTGPGQSVVVTSVAVASNVLTVVCVGLVAPGSFVVLQGLAAGEVPQGAIVQVLPGATSTGFTANIIAPNLTATSGETATATVLVTNGNAPITASQDTYSITGSTVAATAASSSAAGNISVLPVNQNLVAGNLVIVQGLTHGAALNGLFTAVIPTGLSQTNVETNGYIATAVTTGTGDNGVLGLLTTGTPLNGNQVSAGTNLGAEAVQFGAYVSQL